MNKNKQIKNIVLDAYEQEIEKALERGEYSPVADLEASKKMFKEAVWPQLELQKTKSITLRVKNKDLIMVKAKAKITGIPYQRLISTLIHQYAEGKTNIIL